MTERKGIPRRFNWYDLIPLEGLTIEKQAEALGCSTATVIYLRRELKAVKSHVDNFPDTKEFEQ